MDHITSQNPAQVPSSLRFIIKLQISLNSSGHEWQVLVYNKDRSIYYQDSATLPIMSLLNRRPKAYFWAHLDGTELAIDDEAPTQNW